MANWSDFELTLSGHPFNLKIARDEFIKYKHAFNIGDIADENFTHEPPTWRLQAEARWGANLDQLISFLAPYQLSGTLIDLEPGSDFFIEITIENGIITNIVDTDYISDEHFNHCPDQQYWFDLLDYALDDPENYQYQIDFMLKHNIITQEYLQECIQKNKSNQQ